MSLVLVFGPLKIRATNPDINLILPRNYGRKGNSTTEHRAAKRSSNDNLALEAGSQLVSQMEATAQNKSKKHSSG
jgi:hypothetical protein